MNRLPLYLLFVLICLGSYVAFTRGDKWDRIMAATSVLYCGYYAFRK